MPECASGPGGARRDGLHHPHRVHRESGAGRGSRQAVGRHLIVASQRYADRIGRYLDADAVRRTIDGARYDVAGVVSAIYGAVAATAGAHAAGDKSPNDIQFVRVLLDDGFFETVKALHIVRDVRDVMVSMHRLGWLPRLRNGYPRFWSADNFLAANQLSVLTDQYHRIRYEDLVADPVSVLTGACTLLGVAFDPAMVDNDERRRSSQHPDLPHHGRTFDPISPTGVGGYREAFDDEALHHVERLGDEGLRRFGYLP